MRIQILIDRNEIAYGGELEAVNITGLVANSLQAHEFLDIALQAANYNGRTIGG